MKIYNATKGVLNFTLDNGQLVTVAPLSKSSDFLPTSRLIDTFITNYQPNQVGLICTSHNELEMCARTGSAAAFIINDENDIANRYPSESESDLVPTEQVITPTPEIPVLEEKIVEGKVEEIVPEVEKAVEEVVDSSITTPPVAVEVVPESQKKGK